jgi:hypothetical protein
MSDLFWLLKPPYTLLGFGMFVLFLGVFYTYTGKAYIRFHGWVSRTDEPKRYWLEVVAYFVVGAVFIVIFLYDVHAPPN